MKSITKYVYRPLPENEIKRIWRDSLKNSNEKAERIKIEGDDENDASRLQIPTYNTFRL